MSTAATWNDHAWVGRVVDGQFTLLEWLGGSDRGDVFLTELQGHGAQKAAIKLIPAEGPDAQAHIAGWAAATVLSHPHLLRLLQTGRSQIDSARLLYEVMEFAEENLAQIIPERALTPPEAREMLGPILDALAYLHGKGFVHGRLKPSNIMVVENQLKLSSDGIAVAGGRGKSLWTATVYDAPEVASGTVSPAADVWSLGVTLVEALSQHAPVWDRTTHRDPVVPDSLSQPFEGIAQECLRYDAASRPTLAKVKAHLEPARPVTGLASNTGRKRPDRAFVTALIVGVLVLFAVIAGLTLRSRQARVPLPSERPQPVAAIVPHTSQSPPLAPATSSSGRLKGAVAERVLPNVPRSASRTIHGKIKVTVRVTVDASGNVLHAKFDSPGTSKYFAGKALEAAQHWTFRPARVDGRAVSSVWVLPFQFRQTATEVTASEVSP